MLWTLGDWLPIVERIELARDEAKFSLLTRDNGPARPALDAPHESVKRWFKRLQREGQREHARRERARRRRAELLGPIKEAEKSGVVDAARLRAFADEIRRLSRDRRKPDPR